MIIIYRASTGWMADMSRSENADDVYRLCGTYVLPTAYTAEAAEATVRAKLAQRNPTETIIRI